MSTVANTAMQLVCIGFADRLAVPEGGGARMVVRGELGAIVVDVDASEFVGETGEKNLADVVWLSVRAGEHDRLITAARGGSGAAVLPARFGTLFVAEASLHSMLDRHAGAIRVFLANAEGREEWSVKVVGDPAAASKALAARMARERGIDAGSPGAKYLLMRKIEQDASARSAAFMAERSAAALTLLSALCADVRLGRSGKRLEDGTEVVASASLLVDQEKVAELEMILTAAAAEAAREGLSVVWTGPWPPYSFAPALGAEGQGGESA